MLASEGVDDTQEKIIRLVRKAKSVSLKVNVKKTKVHRMNCPDDRIQISGESLCFVLEHLGT